MIQCPNCGKALPDDARFCDECGTVIAQAAPAPAPMPIPTPAPAPQETPAPAPAIAEAPAQQPQAPYIPYNGMQPQPQQPQMGTPFCQNCGAPNSGTPFCVNCGAPMNGPAPQKAAGKKAKAPKAPKAPKTGNGKGSKKGLLIGLIAAAAVVLIAVLVIVLTNIKPSPKGDGASLLNEAIFIQDGEIFYSDLSKKGPFQVTDNFSGGYGLDKRDLYYDGEEIGVCVTLTSDGKYIIYPDRVDYGGYSLYYRSMSKMANGSVKIDSSIYRYYVPENNSNLVFYAKEDSSYDSYVLYVYDIKKGEKEKLASSVRRWMITDDGKTVIYTNDEYTMYQLPVGGEKEKLDSDVVSMGWLDDAQKSIYYLKDDVLYTRVLGKDKVRVDSEVYLVEMVFDGTLYYTKSEEVEYLYRNLITDDMKNSDANLEYPEAPEYPDYSAYSSDEAFEKALEEYDAAYDVYWDELDNYWNRDTREYYREYPCEDKFTVTENTLYFFDGSDKTKVTENYRYSYYYYNNDNGKLVISTYADIDDCVFNLSELKDYSTWGARNIIDDNRYNNGKIYIVEKGSLTEIVLPEDAEVCCVSDDASTIYYMIRNESEIDEWGYEITSNYGTFGAYNVAKGTTEVIDEDVYRYSMTLCDLGILYFKDIDEAKNLGDLYLDGNKIDFDVYIYDVNYYSEINTLFYGTDYNSSREEITLRMYKNGKVEEIANDVVSYAPLADGSVLVLTDYSMNSYTGELYMIKGGKRTKIADDVVVLLNSYVRN